MALFSTTSIFSKRTMRRQTSNTTCYRRRNWQRQSRKGTKQSSEGQTRNRPSELLTICTLSRQIPFQRARSSIALQTKAKTKKVVFQTRTIQPLLWSLRLSEQELSRRLTQLVSKKVETREKRARCLPPAHSLVLKKWRESKKEAQQRNMRNNI